MTNAKRVVSSWNNVCSRNPWPKCSQRKYSRRKQWYVTCTNKTSIISLHVENKWLKYYRRSDTILIWKLLCTFQTETPIWARSEKIQHNGVSAHPRSLIRVFAVCFKDPSESVDCTCEHLRLRLYFAAAQTDLRLRWVAHTVLLDFPYACSY